VNSVDEIYSRVNGIGGFTIPAHTANMFPQGSAIVCIVNRSPTVSVTLSANDIQNAVLQVLETCCGAGVTCVGGQFKITAQSQNVIDLSVQGQGTNCSV
jgi:hypothetical protein